MPAQAEIRQARGDNRGDTRGDRVDSQVRSDVAEDDHPQKRMSLLQRLANVGLGRRDDDMEPPVAGRSGGPSMPPLPDRKPQRSVAQQIATNDPVSEYARRPAPQGLDTHGRRHLWRQRHRVTTILISQPSCDGRPTDNCYSPDGEKGPGLSKPGPLFLLRRSARLVP